MKEDSLILTPKSPKSEDGYRTFSVRLKEELVSHLNSVSVQTGYSRNELIRVFLEYALTHCEIAEETAL